MVRKPSWCKGSCTSVHRHYDPFQRYSRSKSKVVRNCAEFWTFFCSLKFCWGQPFQKLYPNYHAYLAKVYQTSFGKCRRNCSQSHVSDFVYFDSFQRYSWSKPEKIAANFACFPSRKFFGVGPPNFRTCIINYTQTSIMWQSLTAIGWGSSEMLWQNK